MADETSSKGKLRAPPLPWMSPSYSELKENLLPRIIERDQRLADTLIEAAIEEVWRKIQLGEIPHRVVGLDTWSTRNPKPQELELGIHSATITEAGWRWVKWHDAVIALPSRKPYRIEIPSERLAESILPWLRDEEYRRRPPRPARAHPAAPLIANTASSTANITINMPGVPAQPTDQPTAAQEAPAAPETEPSDKELTDATPEEIDAAAAAEASDPAQSDGTPPAKNVGGRPGVVTICLALFHARRDNKLPLQSTIIAEARVIGKDWPKELKTPKDKTIAEHISAAYAEARSVENTQ